MAKELVDLVVVGLGRVGLINALVWQDSWDRASKEYRVLGVDSDPKLLDLLRSKTQVKASECERDSSTGKDPHRLVELPSIAVHPPFHEPSFRELVTGLEDEIFPVYSSLEEVEPELRSKTLIVVVCLPSSPPKEDFHQALGNSHRALGDLVARRFLKPELKTLVIFRSTCSPGYTDRMDRWLRTLCMENFDSHVVNKGADAGALEVLYVPEFLSEGSAVYNARYPRQLVIGARTENGKPILARGTEKILKELFLWFYGADNVLPKNFQLISRISAETGKLALNTFLAARVALTNEVSRFCYTVGADVSDVMDVVRYDSRIGPSYTQPSAGFGGKCLPSSVEMLNVAADQVDLIVDTTNAICRSNGEHLVWISDVVTDQIGKEAALLMPELELKDYLVGKKVSILGLSFKAETNTVENSPARDLAKRFLREGCRVCVHDPKVSFNDFMQSLNRYLTKGEADNLTFSATIEDAFRDASAILVLQPWQSYQHVLSNLDDLKRLRVLAQGDRFANPVLLEACGIIWPANAKAAGFSLIDVCGRRYPK